MDPIGKVQPPGFMPQGVNSATGELPGIVSFFNTILRLMFIVAGVWALINLIMAGFAFMTAGGDPKAIGKAWEKIWQSFLGLLIIVSSFLIAAVIGMILFKDPMAILNPKLTTQ